MISPYHGILLILSSDNSIPSSCLLSPQWGRGAGYFFCTLLGQTNTFVEDCSLLRPSDLLPRQQTPCNTMSLWTCLPSPSPPPSQCWSPSVVRSIYWKTPILLVRALPIHSTGTFNDVYILICTQRVFDLYMKWRHFIFRKCNIKHLQTEGIDSSNSLHENFVTAFGQWASKLVETLYSYQQKTLSPLWMVRLPTCTLSPPLPPPHNVDHQLRSFMGNDVSSTLERGRGFGCV